MTNVILHGCNGRMGQMIAGLCADDPEIRIVAGVDTYTEKKNDFPVFAQIADCEKADAVIDFSNAGALDALLAWCVEKEVPVVLCSTGFSEEQLKKMKNSAVLINTARGPVVDSQALAKALKEGVIAGAAVDVFEMEPPVPADHVLFEAPNLIATPHVAFASQQAFEKRAVIVCGNIKKWLDGEPQNLV